MIIPTPALLPSGAKVKFRLAGGAQPLILLPVRVNEEGPFEFILDTGAGTSLVSPELAKQLQLTVLGSKEGQTAGGKVSVSLAKIHSLSVGEAKLIDVDVGIVDLSQIGETVKAKIYGDLGYNFLKHFRIIINYREREIRLENPKRMDYFRVPARTQIPMRLANPAKPLILVDAHANGRGPFQFAIDTGTSTTVIAPQLAQEVGLASRPVGAGRTGGGQIAVTGGTLDTFMIGGLKVDKMAVVVADFFATLSNAVGAKLDGIVGYNFLRNYNVMIDYPNETLRLL
jgi:predicted aspartyl protease